MFTINMAFCEKHSELCTLCTFLSMPVNLPWFFSVFSAFVLLKQQYNELGLRNEENNYATTWLCPASSYFKDYITLLFLISLPCTQQAAVISGVQFTKSWSKGVLVCGLQFGTAGNPRCTLCGLCAERLAASASTPPTAPELGKEGLSSTGHAVPVLQYSSSSARASLRIPAWSHLEAWQVQLLAGSRPTSPPLRVSGC